MVTQGWIGRPLAAFDLETTGKDPDTALIVTGTLVRITPGEPPVVKTWLADPGIEIPEEASAIHGITTAVAREFGRPARDVVDEVRLSLADVWSDGPVVIYNASYDLTVVTRECGRHHKTPFEVSGPVIDPYILDKALDRYRKGSRTLGETCKHYGVKLDGAHDATEDALAAARVAWKLARTYRLIGESTPDTIHELTAGWFAEQQQSFAKYLRDKVAPKLYREARELAYDPDASTAKAAEADQVAARAAAIAADLKGWPVRGAA
jgi:DNA polymerase-3 subunit epsilon